MDHEANKQAARDHYQALGSGDVELFRSLITEDYRVVITGRSKISGTMSYDQILSYVAGAKDMTQSGFTFDIFSMIAEDDMVASEAEGRATLADGTEFANHYVHLFRFRNGKICEVKEFSDTALAEKALLPGDAS
jgi:ketosteroid isomerase-like protein